MCYGSFAWGGVRAELPLCGAEVSPRGSAMQSGRRSEHCAFDSLWPKGSVCSRCDAEQCCSPLLPHCPPRGFAPRPCWAQRGGGRGACSVPRPLCKLSRSVGDLGSVPSSSAAQSSALSVVSQDGDAQTPQIPPSLTSLCASDPSLPCPAL